MPEQTHHPVSTHPVVSIEVQNDRVLVNGEVLENPHHQELHELAVHHVARSIAGTLGRPVRARATDADGTMGLVVHPDGQVSDMEQLTPAQVDQTDQTDQMGAAVSSSFLDGLLKPEAMPSAPAMPAEPAEPAQPFRQVEAQNGRSRPLFVDDVGERPHLNGHDPAQEWSTSESEPVPGRRALRDPGWAPPEDLAGPVESTPPAGGGLASTGPNGYADAGGYAEPAARSRSFEQVGRRRDPGPGPSHSFLTRHQAQPVAQTGWRGALTRMGLSTPPSEREQSQRECVHAISRHWPGPRTIAIVNGKGGAGKTPTTVVLASLFARHGGSGILAWDNNETRGTLGWRTEQGPHEAHVLTMLPYTERLMEPTARSADLAAFVHHQTEDKYDVLRSNPEMLASEQRLTASDFDAVHRVASKYFRLIFVDSGNDETAPHWRRMIDHADQIVVATTTRPDHAEAGRLLLDALRERDEHSAQLAQQAVVVVSQADREEVSADEIAAGFDGRARAALTVPYDRALRAPWLRFNTLNDATQHAYLRAAAAVSDGL